MSVQRRNAILGLLAFGFVLFIAFRYQPPPQKYQEVESPYYDDYSDIIGIDLGREYARVGVLRNNTVELISDEQGRTAIPNYVAFTGHGHPLVGFEAKEQAFSNPKNTIYDYWRLIGRRFTNPKLQEAIKGLPYDVVSVGGKPLIKIGKNNDYVGYDPEHISRFILKKLRSMAESQLNTTIKHAIITVPSHFDKKQQQATKDAAETAGLEVLRILDEDSSTLRAYDLYSKRCREDGCIYVTYNIRGEESYLALAEMDRGAVDIIGTVTNANLGLESSEASVETAQTRLNSLNKQQSAQVNGLIKQLLIDAKFQKNDVDGIIITGDSPHTLAIQEVLEAYFPGKKVLAPPGFEHGEALVYGASLWGSFWLQENQDPGYELLDVNPLSLGIEASNGRFLRVIRRNNIANARGALTVSTSADNQERVNIRILEGEREIAGSNRLLGTRRLSGIPPAPKGVPEIKVTLVWDRNEILTATAQLKGASRVAKFVAPVKANQYTYQRKDDIIRDAEEKFYEKDLEKLKEGSIRVLHGVERWER